MEIPVRLVVSVIQPHEGNFIR